MVGLNAERDTAGSPAGFKRGSSRSCQALSVNLSLQVLSSRKYFMLRPNKISKQLHKPPFQLITQSKHEATHELRLDSSKIHQNNSQDLRRIFRC